MARRLSIRACGRAVLWVACVEALACIAGCTDPDGSSMNVEVVDAPVLPDAPAMDTPASDVAMDAPLTDAPTDAGTDAACDAPCIQDNPCVIVSGCACIETPLPDDTSCGTHGETCQAEVCTPPPPGCGSLWRDLTPTREGCDDGNTVDGDACSSTCTPTILVISSPAGEEASAVAAAADGTGSMLFSWVESVPPTVSAERTLSVRAAIYSATGVLLVAPIDLETGIGVGQPIAPSVAGLAVGWAVAWRSTTIEGSDADLGGIAYTVIDPAGVRGRVRQANTEERFDQREPSVAPYEDGFVIAWTDGSDRPADPGLGIRVRSFDALGRPAAGWAEKMSFAGVTLGDQSQPVIAGIRGSSLLGLAFTDASTGMPIAHLRRSADPGPLPLADRWSSSPSISLLETGDVWAGWLAQPTGSPSDPESDLLGGAYLQLIPSTETPAAGSAFPFGTPRRDDGVAVAARDLLTPVIGWRTDAAPQGLRVEPEGWTFPPEGAELSALLAGGRERGLRLVPTYDGLWLTWIDASVPGATSGVVAYLLPWN